MEGLRARALALVGMLCLVGQGVLLHAGSTGATAPRLPLPWLFTLLGGGVALALALTPRRRDDHADRERLLWRLLSLLAVAVLLGTSLAYNLVASRAPARPADHSAALDRAVARAAAVAPAVVAWWEDGAPVAALDLAARSVSPAPADTVPPRGGDLFRHLEAWPAAWRAAGLELPAGAILWRDGERMAWCGNVEPLGTTKARTAPPDLPEWRRSLRPGREGWILQQMTVLATGEILELQVRLALPDLKSLDADVEMVVGAVDDPALSMDDSGLLIEQVGFGPDGGAPYAHLLARPESPAEQRNVSRARLLLAALLAWAVACAGLARLAGGVGALI